MGDFREEKEPELAIATIEAAAKSILQASQQETDGGVISRAATVRDLDYPVADLLGRFFLRVFFWADVFSSWTRRTRALRFSMDEGVPQAMTADLPVTHAATGRAGNASTRLN